MSRVSLTFPAETENIAIARTTAAAMAARCDLTIDQVEDVRLAVDEAVSQLILVAPGSQITCEFTARTGELGLLAWSNAAVNLRFDTDSFGWTVMRALVDTLEDASTPDGPALALRIARREAVQA